MSLLSLLSFIDRINLPAVPGAYTTEIAPKGKLLCQVRQVPVPTAPRESGVLAGLSVYEVTLTPEKQKEPTQWAHVVREDELRRALWANYKVNLTALLAMDHVSRAIRPNDMQEATTEAQDAARQAFGTVSTRHLSIGRPSVLLRRLESGFTPEQVSPCLHFGQAYALVAYLELHKRKKASQPLPAGDAWLVFVEGEERVEAHLAESGERGAAVSVRLDAEQLAADKGTADQLRELFRLRQQQDRLNQDAFSAMGEVLEQSRRFGDTEKKDAAAWHKIVRDDDGAAHVLLGAADPATEKKLEQAQSARAQSIGLEERIFELYVAITRWVAKHKERIFATRREQKKLADIVVRSREELKKREFVQIASNMEGLPQHFAAIPSGLADGLDLTTDQFGRAVLKVKREALRLSGHPVREHPSIDLELPTQNAEQTALLDQARVILGDGGPRWLVPQGLVAVSALYRAAGGYSRPDFAHRLYLNDWIDAMRPTQVARFREKGRGEAFGRGRNPKLYFNALLRVLSALRFEWSPEKGKTDIIDGFYVILGHGTDSTGYYVDLMLNPKQMRLIDGARPLYMVTDARAMLGYPSQALDYTPAAQLSLELLARANLFSKAGTPTLTDPKGGGITRLAYASRFGLIKGPNDSPKDLLRRLNSIFDNLRDAGVIADIKVDGRDKTGGDAFGVKLLVTMSDDYRAAYDVARQERTLVELDRQLERPFAPVKRPRGRPAKNK